MTIFSADEIFECDSIIEKYGRMIQKGDGFFIRCDDRIPGNLLLCALSLKKKKRQRTES